MSYSLAVAHLRRNLATVAEILEHLTPHSPRSRGQQRCSLGGDRNGGGSAAQPERQVIDRERRTASGAVVLVEHARSGAWRGASTGSAGPRELELLTLSQYG